MRNLKTESRIKNQESRGCRPFFLASLFLLLASPAFAASLTVVRDTISTSGPSLPASHEIIFTVSNAVPPGGKIVITPDSGVFVIPVGMNFLDADIAVDTTGSYVDRSLSATPSATDDGLSVISGSSGSFSFTLNGTTGISAGGKVQIELGSNASFAATGTNSIINPSATVSYRIQIRTENASGSQIDSGTAMIAIVAPVTGGPVDTSNTNPPVISNGLPSGLLPSGTAAVELSVQTDVVATCKYTTTAGVLYASSTSAFPFTGGLVHSGAVISGLVDGSTYNYYVRCQNYQSIVNTSDYVITFTIGIVPSTAPPPPPPPPPSSSGGGPLGGGNFLKSADVTISGTAYASSKVSILKDGKTAATVSAAADGAFSTKIIGLERGTYTFGIYATDAKGQKSANISSTVSVIAGTGNTVTKILLSPTVSAEKTSIDPGQTLALFGYAIPKSTLEVSLLKQGGEREASIATTTTLANGEWYVDFDTKGFSVGAYEVRARAILESGDSSGFSGILPIGIGQEAAPDLAARSDLNHDNKVNLIDFSILLFSWGKDDPAADINGNGKVDLADFSILIFYWTG